ncbi:hypothetical protein S40288_02391 [Stachybotrys chartarum IBT 40288]|nr:hypothetical protein S40288_02391 [Stachybotrys chartarum IBT 40288]
MSKAHIRLLILEPGAPGDPLIGHLEEVDLNEVQGKYTALSYVWGSSTQAEEIIIEHARVRMTSNLDKALRRLRSRTAKITLWVDAVCIDQTDVAEKHHQVPLMARIYTQAETVLSWLGEATQHSATGMEILSYLSSNEPFNDNSPWNRLNGPEIVLGLHDILQRHYFQRVWIVQEAALGRRIQMQVGDVSIHWHKAEDARRFLARIKLLEVSPAWHSGELRAVDLRPIRELLEQSVASRDREMGISRAATLLDLVHTMRHMQSSDPRDKIFGLMGLAPPAEIAGFFPDYADSWERTYQRFYDHVYRNALQEPSRPWRTNPGQPGV